MKLTLAIFAALALASPAAAASPARLVVAQAQAPTGEGMVNALYASARKVNLTHGPVAALNWPGMTMDFGLAPGVDLSPLNPGAKIVFTLKRGADGMYVIDSFKPAP